jgi:hypothetical protein
MDKAPTPGVAYNTNLLLHHNHDVDTAVDGYIEVKYEKDLRRRDDCVASNLVLHHNHDVDTAVDGYIEVKYEKDLTEEEMTVLRCISLVNSKMPANQNMQ